MMDEDKQWFQAMEGPKSKLASSKMPISRRMKGFESFSAGQTIAMRKI